MLFPPMTLRDPALVPPIRLNEARFRVSNEIPTPIVFGCALLPAGLTPRKQPSTTLLLEEEIRIPRLHPWPITSPRIVLPPLPEIKNPSPLLPSVAPLSSTISLPLKPLASALLLVLDPGCV